MTWFFQLKAAGASNDLFDYIECLEREEKYSIIIINIEDTISDSSSIIRNRDPETVDVWQDIDTALND